MAANDSTALQPVVNPRAFDTVEIQPSSLNYGRKEDNNRLSLPAFTAEAHGDKATDNIDKDSLLLDDDKPAVVDEDAEMEIDDAKLAQQDSQHHGGGTKFGMFDGVLGRCLLCMWGVIMVCN